MTVCERRAGQERVTVTEVSPTEGGAVASNGVRFRVMLIQSLFAGSTAKQGPSNLALALARSGRPLAKATLQCYACCS